MNSFNPAGPATEQAKIPCSSGWDPVNLYEYELYAKEHLPKNAFDYYASGANDMVTLRENRHAYQRLRLRPRVLRDVSEVDISTTILGDKFSSPICVAPTAMQQMAHHQGECANARACTRENTLMVLSSLSTMPLEDVAVASGPSRPVWFQLYVYRDREVVKDLVYRAEKAGYKALAVVVDTPILGRREADVRNRFKLPEHLTLGNFLQRGGVLADGAKEGGSDSGLAVYCSGLIDRTLNWNDIEWLRSITSLKIVLKGIMTAEDALIAVQHGVDGILISNHGARQLDTVAATIEVVPEIVRAVKGRCEVYLDGGIMRGSDAFKAIALGCRAVFVGRPVLWGLAHNGEEGVARVLQLLKAEFSSCMQLCGSTNVSEINHNMVVHCSQYSRL